MSQLNETVNHEGGEQPETSCDTPRRPITFQDASTEAFNCKVVRRLGITQLVLAAVILLLNIVGLLLYFVIFQGHDDWCCAKGHPYKIASGMWAAVFFILSGTLSLHAPKKTRRIIRATLAFSILSLIMALVISGVAIWAIVNDYKRINLVSDHLNQQNRGFRQARDISDYETVDAYDWRGARNEVRDVTDDAEDITAGYPWGSDGNDRSVKKDTMNDEYDDEYDDSYGDFKSYNEDITTGYSWWRNEKPTYPTTGYPWMRNEKHAYPTTGYPRWRNEKPAYSTTGYPWWRNEKPAYPTTGYPWWRNEKPADPTTGYPWWKNEKPAYSTTGYPWWRNEKPAYTTTVYPWWRNEKPAYPTTDYPWWRNEKPANTTTGYPWWGNEKPAYTTTGYPWWRNEKPAYPTTAYPWWGNEKPADPTTDYPWWRNEEPAYPTTGYPWWRNEKPTYTTTGYPWWRNAYRTTVSPWLVDGDYEDYADDDNTLLEAISGLVVSVLFFATGFAQFVICFKTVVVCANAVHCVSGSEYSVPGTFLQVVDMEGQPITGARIIRVSASKHKRQSVSQSLGSLADSDAGTTTWSCILSCVRKGSDSDQSEALLAQV